MKKEIYSNKVPKAIGPYSQAIKSNNLIFISGQIAIDIKEGKLIAKNIFEETTIIMENIKNILAESNCTFENVVKSTIFLSDINVFDNINKVYEKYFSKPYPARETVEASRLPKNVNIEISMIAISK
jgi:2-iminobutanoate/2-iminopropanoate deaminase